MSEVMKKVISLQELYGLPVNSAWVDMVNNVNVPRAPSSITLEYDGMPDNVVSKQADIVLISSSLNIQNYTLENMQKDLTYYNRKQTSDGPAMTYSIMQRTKIALLNQSARYSRSICKSNFQT